MVPTIDNARERIGALVAAHRAARPDICAAADRYLAAITVRLGALEAEPSSARRDAETAILAARLQAVASELASLPIVTISPRVTP
jgi:hypothetical protein